MFVVPSVRLLIEATANRLGTVSETGFSQSGRLCLSRSGHVHLEAAAPVSVALSNGSISGAHSIASPFQAESAKLHGGVF